MNGILALLPRAALLAGLVAPQGRDEGRPALELWVFISPEGPDLAAQCRSIGRVKREHRSLLIRPCLLAEDWGFLRKASELEVKNIQALGRLVGPGFGLPVVDEEGLSRARELGIERLPAFALFDGKSRRVHLAYGCGAQVAELFQCE